MKSCYCVQQALHVDVNPCTTLSSNYICLARIIPVLCFYLFAHALISFGSLINCFSPAAMILLKQPLSFTSNKFPVCLLPSGARFLPGTVCFVTGWGRLASNGLHPTKLFEAQVPLISREVCNVPEIYNGIIHERALCAGTAEGGVGPCQFDSGGPLVCQERGLYYLTGIVSWGVGCGEYCVYSDMSVLTEWVRNIISTDGQLNQ